MRLSLLLLAAALACSSDRAPRPTDTAAGSAPPAAAAPSPAARYQGRTVAEWIAQLGDMDHATRQAAESVLVEIGPDAIPALVAAADGPDRATSTRAAIALLSMCPDEGALIRAELARVRDPRVRAQLDTVARAVAHPDSFPGIGTPILDRVGFPRYVCIARGGLPPKR